MKRKRYTDEQIAYALRQAEAGTPVAEICRNMGVSQPISSIDHPRPISSSYRSQMG